MRAVSAISPSCSSLLSLFRVEIAVWALGNSCSIMTVAAADAEGAAGQPASMTQQQSQPGPPYTDAAALDAHVQRAWEYFRSLGSPKWHVAPMVDQSELPFRMLCRAHGAEAAYTPMLHSRLFVEQSSYRKEHFSTCEGDRPLFIQFCANDPATFVTAAQMIQEHGDYIDLNFGCPQRIAKRGNYGAFLMDDLPLIEQLVLAGAQQLSKPISCKIRLFGNSQQLDIKKSIEYAQMLERAGCSLLAIHGRTREVKDNSAVRANWDGIAAVRAAVRIPVLANGDVQCLADAQRLMEHTKADGVLSAEPLLMDPALFSSQRPPEATITHLESYQMCQEYVALVAANPAHPRMVKGHVHKLLRNWLAEFTDYRERINRVSGSGNVEALQKLVSELGMLIAGTGRDHPIPKITERKLKQMEREAAKQASIEEQDREAALLAGRTTAAAATDEPAGQVQVHEHQQSGQQQQRPQGHAEQQEQQQVHLGKHSADGSATVDEPALKRQQTLPAEEAVAVSVTV